jgi:hypothetical protein
MIPWVIATLFAFVAGFNIGRRGKTYTREVIPEGYVHQLHISDPDHYDEHGRYLWRGD